MKSTVVLMENAASPPPPAPAPTLSGGFIPLEPVPAPAAPAPAEPARSLDTLQPGPPLPG